MGYQSNDGHTGIRLFIFILLAMLAACAQSAMTLSGQTKPARALTPIFHEPAQVYHVQRAATRPVIDGQAGEWAAVPAMVLDQKSQARGWDGPQDLHGGLRLQWADDGLYFCLEVVDDVHSAPNATSDWWANDGSQFAFDPYMNGPRGGYDSNEHSYVVCDSPDGPLLAAYRLPGQASEGGKRLTDRTVKMGVRPDGTRIFEWMMTWEQLAPVSPWVIGRTGFTFTLNDDDGKGFEGALFWTKGLLYSQDASQFGQIIFDGAEGAHASMVGLPPEEQITDQQADSLYLPIAGHVPWGKARLLVCVPGGGPVEGTATVYRAGTTAQVATGTLKGQAPADAPLLLTWNLDDLPPGQYEIAYTVTKPALGTQRFTFTQCRLNYLREQRAWLRTTFATDRPWDALAEAPPIIRRHRGLVALTLNLLEDDSWTLPLYDVDKLQEHINVLMYCSTMVSALQKNQDVLGAQRGCFWSAYYSPVDGSGQTFVLLLPPRFDPKKTYPLVVDIHGAGAVPMVQTQAKYSGPPAITVYPWARGASSGYGKLSENDVLQVIDYVKTWYRIDPDRVYLTGGSMGGSGTWFLSSRHPDLFAAAAPFYGGSGGASLENLRHVPVFNQHGAKDWTSSIDYSRYAVSELQHYGYTVLHKEYPEGEHNNADWPDIRPWLLQHRRVQRPAVVTFTCQRPDAPFNSAYWVTVRELADPHAAARVNAVVHGSGSGQSLALSLDNAAVVEIDLTQAPLDRVTRLLLQLDQQLLEQPKPLPDRLVLRRTATGWTIDQGWTPPASAIRPYRAGAAANLFTGEAVMVVYGTRCSEARRQVLQATARRFAEYPDSRGVPMPGAHFAVRADADVTAEDIEWYNLILVGGLQENGLTARLLPQLPFSLDERGELLAGNREPVSLRGALLQCLYYNPQAPQRLVYLFATDEDSPEARKMLAEPYWQVNGRWDEILGDVPDLTVTDIDGTERRRMQFTHAWQWLSLPGADRPAPLRYFSLRESTRALLTVLSETMRIDYALGRDVPPADDSTAPAQPVLRMADLAVMRSPICTVVGTLTGKDLIAAYEQGITNGRMISVPAFTPETLDPERRYRVALPLGDLFVLTGIQRNLSDTAVGPLVPYEALLAELTK